MGEVVGGEMKGASDKSDRAVVNGASEAVSAVPASVPSAKGWPADGGPLDFEAISRPVLHAIRFAYTLERRDRRKNIPWRGPEIGESMRACSPLAKERLKAHRLAYAEEDQGRDTLEEIVGLAIQLGIEQGRRIARSEESRLLDSANGAVFTVRVDWQGSTSLHTQSGFLSDPVACLRAAMGAFEYELARVENCPRYRALAQGAVG